MSSDNIKQPKGKGPNPAASGAAKGGAGSAITAAPLPPLFRRIDWIAGGLTMLLVWIGYLLSIAPDVTLQDSGELAVGSYYAGVPHPPGYPVWTIYTWLFTVLVPIANVAFRVALANSVAASFSCGMIALIVSRGSSMIMEGLEDLKGIEQRWENLICMVSGFVAGCLIGFNGFFWSQAVIVEVYCLGVSSLMVVICFLLRWLYAPHQYRYLYWAAFVFGICFTNHQTLLVAAMGIEVAVLAVNHKLGRDLFLFNSVCFVGILFGKYLGIFGAFDQNLPLFVIFNVIGIGSIYTFFWYSLKVDYFDRLKLILVHLGGNILIWAIYLYAKNKGNINDSAHTMLIAIFNSVGIGLMYFYYWMMDQGERLLSEWKQLLFIGLSWCFGAGFYFYMPIASMTNPPMNWGYARTYEGFLHALTRGQYEKANPTATLGKFFEESIMYLSCAVEEFNLVYLLIGIIPFVVFYRMQKREKSWLTGLLAIFLCLGVLLLILLNPNSDRASRDLNKVFFTSSFAVVTIFVGYGLTVIAAYLAMHYQRIRFTAICLGAVAAAIAVFALHLCYSEPTTPMKQYAAIYGIVLAAVFIGALLLARNKAPMVAVLSLFALMPVHTVMSHWAENEQFGHLFGFWFGHDMFTPPDFGKKGQFYPEMTRNAVLFGGTDPGRFCPTYMIFCESFIPPGKRRDPNFDRRDVYLITQNALADGTYLNYIRAHYNRSTQIDPPFFQEMVRSLCDKAARRQEGDTSERDYFLPKLVRPLDWLFTNIGAWVEARRRAQGVYPPKEISTPNPEESKKCFEEYIGDAQRRLQLGQLEPGEDVRVVENRVQVSGQVSVMQINGLLTKVIFDKNPDHEFFVEESFPLKWMYPYLSPFGIIMKINRQPVPEFTEELVKKDHDFWSLYADRLCGNWINYDTSVKDICAFAERTYQRMDFRGFKGDRKFVRDNDAQKAFSKLRSAIAGLYAWRVAAAKAGSAEQQRVFKEAEFAFKQAFAFCPYSPEAVFRYVNLLLSAQRVDEAILIAQTCQKFDPENRGVNDLVEQLKMIKQGGRAVAASHSQLAQVEQQWQANPGNIPLAFNLAQMYQQQQLTNQANAVLDRVIAQLDPQFRINPSNVQAGIWLVQAYTQRQRLNEATQVMDLLITNLEQQYRANTNNAIMAMNLVQAYLQRQKTTQALELLDVVVALPGVDSASLMAAAQNYAMLGNPMKLEVCLQKLVKVVPDNAEAWYDLAAVQAVLAKDREAMTSLTHSVQISRERQKKQPGAKDLAAAAAQDGRFQALRPMPEYKAIMNPKLEK